MYIHMHTPLHHLNVLLLLHGQVWMLGWLCMEPGLTHRRSSSWNQHFGWIWSLLQTCVTVTTLVLGKLQGRERDSNYRQMYLCLCKCGRGCLFFFSELCYQRWFFCKYISSDLEVKLSDGLCFKILGPKFCRRSGGRIRFKIKIQLLPALFTIVNTTWRAAIFCNTFRYTIVSLGDSLSLFSKLGAGGRRVRGWHFLSTDVISKALLTLPTFASRNHGPRKYYIQRTLRPRGRALPKISQ